VARQSRIKTQAFARIERVAAGLSNIVRTGLSRFAALAAARYLAGVSAVRGRWLGHASEARAEKSTSR